ncbi:hypothetical protein [Falsirhodobacter xinxiangensis]|uniref:hypothetical protein n=1 Tax=Falsirhodobacter xinxiangensis TaxID=2530049 RepID=UPI0010AAE308|nr:hypothetical protein [Rhodobacter xinxiangensis]
MTKIIRFPSTPRVERSRNRGCQRYNVSVRIELPKNGRRAAEDLLYGHLFRLLQKLHGFDQTRGFTIEALRAGGWHKLPHAVRPDLLDDFLIAIDGYCNRGWLKVKVNGARLAMSKRA